MAKELPYFKFEPAEYLTKDISFCSLSAQGLFINICCYYWQRNCKLTKKQLLKRLNHETELNELIDEGVIDLKGEDIVIKFLDLQLFEVEKTSRTNSINGSKGGRPKKPKKNPIKTEKKPTALISLSETKGIREDKIREDKIKEDNFYKIEDLKNFYLGDEKIIEAVLNNKENKFNSKEHLIKRLNYFCDMLFENGTNQDTFKNFASYFRRWHKKNIKQFTPQKPIF